MNQFYTAAEAIRRLNIPRSTFYYLVNQGEIPKIILPLRKQAVYPKDKIDKLIQERREIAKDLASLPQKWSFITPSLEDLNQLIEIEHSVWGNIGIIDPEDILKRLPYNPENIHVLKNTDNQEVVGSITASPLVSEVINKLITFQIDESDIKPTEYLAFLPEIPLDCYIISLITRQNLYSNDYAFILLREIERYFVELVERGVTIKKVYTVATTEDGERLARKIGFKELSQGKGPLGDQRKAFILDLTDKLSPSEFLKRYQIAIRNRQQRIRRHKKQATPNGEILRPSTDWIKPEDLPYVLALDYEVYGPEATVDLSITRKWWQKNPYACRIMFNETNRKEIWGVLSVLPMEEETIIRILKGEMNEHEITADQILTYETGHTYNGYIASTIIRPEYRSYFRMLLQGTLDFWCENADSFQIQKLYAYAFSDEGMNLIKHLFFSPRYDLDTKAYELNLIQPNPSRLVRAFQECIKAKAQSL